MWDYDWTKHVKERAVSALIVTAQPWVWLWDSVSEKKLWRSRTHNWNLTLCLQPHQNMTPMTPNLGPMKMPQHFYQLSVDHVLGHCLFSSCGEAAWCGMGPVPRNVCGSWSVLVQAMANSAEIDGMQGVEFEALQRKSEVNSKPYSRSQDVLLVQKADPSPPNNFYKEMALLFLLSWKRKTI